MPTYLSAQGTLRGGVSSMTSKAEPGVALFSGRLKPKSREESPWESSWMAVVNACKDTATTDGHGLLYFRLDSVKVLFGNLSWYAIRARC